MYNFKEVEGQAREIWEKHEKEIEKSVQERRGRLFSFLEGPPTANAPPGLHHLELRTYKDLICKFKFMQGFSVPRKGGWDCHGLPVEVQIEKKLNLNSKKDIEKHGVEKFIKECRESVFSYIEEWEKSTQELNYWIDLENPYRTLDNDYTESVWWSLKELYNKKLLYEDKKVVPFCPRCETPLSSHEVAQGYKKLKEETIVAKFKLESGEYMLAWTTTPWTLPSNLALAVNQNIDYAVVEKDGRKYILAKELVKNFFSKAKIIKTFKGEDLLGKKYEPLLPYYNNLKNSFKIIEGDFVELAEGTGIVHMAPAFGEVDFEACRKNGIDFVNPVNTNGKFSHEIPELDGTFIKAADAKITEKLEKEGKLFTKISYEHDYPYCWRCESPLMYYAIRSWFIRVSKVKEDMIRLNKKINWVPDYIQDGRFGDWLENIKDWALSRNKFWGTPLPVWRCECGNEIIIGSIEELKKNSVKKLAEKEIDLHKPWIENVKLKCKCSKEMARVSEVIDCWYDSGCASFAQFHYPFENKEYFKKRYPYDFIAEGIDQTRGWFYTLHAIGTILFGKEAYKNVICAGHIVDENGEKMSKSKGNIIPQREIFDNVGVDATRLQFCTSDTGNQKRFSANLVKESVLPFLTILINANKYCSESENGKETQKIEDKWILSRLNSTINNATSFLEKFDINNAYAEISGFVVNDLSRGYIKMTRERKTKPILKEVLMKIVLILAPFAPYISEYIYSQFSKNSVHLSNWPKVDKKKIDKKLEQGMAIAQEIIERILSERAKPGVGIRWPLAKAIIHTKEENTKILMKMQEIIKLQGNIKEIKIKKSREEKVELDIKITPELEAEGFSREICRRVQEARKKLGMQKGQKIDILVKSDSELQKMLQKNEEFIKERVNASRLKFSAEETPEEYKFSAEEEIRGRKIEIHFSITKKE
ncbi:isoleucine--tRNA ligase [Candidatus Pacearchaeota archaeon]|nr:isoleucine--tRNA ligase [Candidatus Pacearchaeota archaeon]